MDVTSLDRIPSVDDLPFEGDVSAQAAPEGAQFHPDPNKWYYIQADFQRDGATAQGYLCPVGSNATRAFWDYIAISPYKGSGCKLKFKKMEGQAWYTAEVQEDGYHLCMKATGWLYRASAYTAGFMIIDGKLYVDSWSGPLGYANSYKLDSETYYVGADLSNQLLNVTLVEA